ncbi:MAG TPA: transposase [Oculatellaceae cyanobacterium]|jgi:REP element-mobilizing transposase RayT
MKYNPDKHHRRSIRLPGYDYTQAGLYFITICIWQRECLLGHVINSTVELNRYGQVVQYNWNLLAKKFTNVQLDEFVIMPNHIHGVIKLIESGNQPLSEVIRSFKTSSTRRINQLRESIGVPVWQRNYYEHIIRNEESFNIICEYIINNPLSWEQDQLHPNNPSKW